MVRDNAVKMSSQVGQEDARAAPTLYNSDLGAAKSVAGTVRVTTLRKLFSFPRHLLQTPSGYCGFLLCSTAADAMDRLAGLRGGFDTLTVTLFKFCR